MAIHRLKTWPTFWIAVNIEKKTFEVRRNDRDFKIGDLLELVWFDPKTGFEDDTLVL